jgi:filamentous hemagglutinin
MAQGAAVAYLQELGASQVRQIADSLDNDAARASLHAIVGCAGAAAGGQDCGAGAMGAAASSVIGSLLGPTANMSAVDREARENLVNSLVAGIAAAGGVDASTATGAAQIEVENNQVSLTTSTGFRLPPIPGFKGETASKGDGVIADPATELDASIKAGRLITPAGDPRLIEQIFTPVGNAVKELVDYVTTAASTSNATDANGLAPPNMSPDGAGRSGAFKEAKRANGIPVTQHPSAVRPNTDRRGNSQPGYQYEFKLPLPSGDEKTIIIRDDASGHFFGEGNAQNRGPHFNDPAGNHYDY